MTRFTMLWIVVVILLGYPQSIAELVLFYASLRPTNGPSDLAELAAFEDGKTVIVFAHQDDDVLWMLPFWPKAQKFLLAAYPAFPQLKELVRALPSELHYDQKWEPIWGVRNAEEFA